MLPIFTLRSAHPFILLSVSACDQWQLVKIDADNGELAIVWHLGRTHVSFESTLELTRQCWLIGGFKVNNTSHPSAPLINSLLLFRRSRRKETANPMLLGYQLPQIPNYARIIWCRRCTRSLTVAPRRFFPPAIPGYRYKIDFSRSSDKREPLVREIPLTRYFIPYLSTTFLQIPR